MVNFASKRIKTRQLVLIDHGCTLCQTAPSAYERIDSAARSTAKFVYVYDFENDLYAALNARVRCLWIPSRALQDVKKISGRGYIRFILNFLKNEIVINNQASVAAVLQLFGINKEKII